MLNTSTYGHFTSWRQLISLGLASPFEGEGSLIAQFLAEVRADELETDGIVLPAANRRSTTTASSIGSSEC
jgi:hypothetical protein